MLIKQQALRSHLAQNLAAFYIIFGQDCYLLNEAAETLKLAFKAKNKELDESIITINSSSDWDLVEEETNSYSLFASAVLIDLRFDKKTLDARAKEFFKHYLEKSNCLIVMRAPNLPLKQLQGLANADCLHLVQATALPPMAMQKWIADKLQEKGLQFEQAIPSLIQQFTEGNMLACAQVIEKLELSVDEGAMLTNQLVREQLVNQCDYQLFDLTDACLANNPEKVLQVLTHARHSKVEPSLILWFLAQEIRLLLQLNEMTNTQAMPFNTACNQLKIWPQRTKFYQANLKKFKLSTLIKLIEFCKTVDERIKSTQNTQVWQSLEQIALSLSLTKEVGSFA